MGCRKTRFFLKQIWVSVEGNVPGSTLTARNWGAWPPSSNPARTPPQPWIQIIWMSPFWCFLWLRGQVLYHPMVKPAPNIPMPIVSGHFLAWLSVFIAWYSSCSWTAGGLSASAFLSFQFALNILLLLFQGRRRLAAGPECLSKETHETSGNYEAGQQNQWGLQAGASFPGSLWEAGMFLELHIMATKCRVYSAWFRALYFLLIPSHILFPQNPYSFTVF